MNVLLFGATGMVGQGVLRECLLDPQVGKVVTVGRSATGQQHAKLHEIVHADLFDISALETELSGFDACFFCLGTSSSGMTETEYHRITYDLTLGIARTLARLNPSMTLIYVSGAGADSTERGRVMWARVRGMTENDLLGLPFKAVYIFRPALIQPLHGIRSRTRLYRVFYSISGAVFPLLKRLFPQYVSTTEQLGRAMLAAVRKGAPVHILSTPDINQL